MTNRSKLLFEINDKARYALSGHSVTILYDAAVDCRPRRFVHRLIHKNRVLSRDEVMPHIRSLCQWAARAGEAWSRFTMALSTTELHRGGRPEIDASTEPVSRLPISKIFGYRVTLMTCDFSAVDRRHT